MRRTTIMKIIALGNQNRVGKDTAADYLVSKGWVKLSFADCLKETVSKLYQIPLIYFYDQYLKEKTVPFWNMSPRDILIKAGEKLREGNNSHFVRVIHLKILTILNSGLDPYQNIFGSDETKILLQESAAPNIVISDLRFPVELEYIEKMGITPIRILRNNTKTEETKIGTLLNNTNFKHFIWNDKTIEIFKDRIDSCVSDIPKLQFFPTLNK